MSIVQPSSLFKIVVPVAPYNQLNISNSGVWNLKMP